MASLIVLAGPAANEDGYFKLGKRTMVVGRDEAASIQITDPLVSRKHLHISCADFEAGNYSLLDLKSANGTLVNGRDVSEVELQDGDRIEIGSSTLVFSTQDFDGREDAMRKFHTPGERGKSTLIQ